MGSLTENQRLLLLAAAAADLLRVSHGWVNTTNPGGRLFSDVAVNSLLRRGLLEVVEEFDADRRPVRVCLSADGRDVIRQLTAGQSRKRRK